MRYWLGYLLAAVVANAVIGTLWLLWVLRWLPDHDPLS